MASSTPLPHTITSLLNPTSITKFHTSHSSLQSSFASTTRLSHLHHHASARHSSPFLGAYDTFSDSQTQLAHAFHAAVLKWTALTAELDVGDEECVKKWRDQFDLLVWLMGMWTERQKGRLEGGDVREFVEGEEVVVRGERERKVRSAVGGFEDGMVGEGGEGSGSDGEERGASSGSGSDIGMADDDAGDGEGSGDGSVEEPKRKKVKTGKQRA